MQNYLETEKTSKLLLKFSLPCVLSLLISALYNIVDQIFIGNSNVGAIGNSNVYNPKLSIDNSLNIVLSFSYNDGEYVVMNQVLQVI